jgi:arginine utilization protein RocB
MLSYHRQRVYYTLAYLFEQILKHKGIHRPELTELVRKIVHSMLQLVPIGTMELSDMFLGIKDSSFLDLEDSFQYQCALKNQCNYMISINIKDFPNTSNEIIAVTLNEFVDRIIPYLHQ